MQRGGYGPPPANSPPLHHPVPQHVSTVPMMRSPPPPQSQGGSNYGSPYAGQMGSGQPQQTGGAQGMMGGQFAPAFGGFMNDQTAQMGIQVGQQAFQAGQAAMEQSVCSLVKRTLRPSQLQKSNFCMQLTEKEERSLTLTMPSDKSLCLRLRSQTLLQCLNSLCAPQAPPCPIPLAS